WRSLRTPGADCHPPARDRPDYYHARGVPCCCHSFSFSSWTQRAALTSLPLLQPLREQPGEAERRRPAAASGRRRATSSRSPARTSKKR
ncbi:unnamed protein product, partial [Ectocarpus sp. 13 AM-2016]